MNKVLATRPETRVINCMGFRKAYIDERLVSILHYHMRKLLEPTIIGNTIRAKTIGTDLKTGST